MTDYLSKISPVWKARVGVGATVTWPVTTLVGKGDDGVGMMVQQTQYSLGYVDYVWATKNNAHFAAVKNREGQFVVAQPESLTSAAASINPVPADLRMSITDAPGSHSYPIAAFSYLLVPQYIEGSKRTALSDFLKWMMTEGQKDVAGFNYAPLPPAVVSSEKRLLPQIK